jgi:hypothetical protein
MLKLLAVSLSMLFLVGCATTKYNDNQIKEAFKQHVIAIDKVGDLVDSKEISVKSYTTEDQYIDEILNKSKGKIIIYIHGGLNGPGSTNVRLKELSGLMLQDGYYPIFISWRSGPFTTYWDHLVNQRQGENWPIAGALTSPLILASDLGRGLTRLPISWWYQINSYSKGISFDPCSKQNPSERNATTLSCNYISGIPGKDKFGEITKLTPNYDGRTSAERIWDGFIGGAKLFPGLAVVPIADSLATGAWDVMKQRTEVMFTKVKPWKAEGYTSVDSYTKNREGALTKFLTKLSKVENKEIILIGHSMGTIVANKILLQQPDLHFSRIIYMAAACSIKDFQAAVIPYLQNPKHKKTDQNEGTEFYNYTLHPVAENLESYRIVGAGSLLTLIDNVFENQVFENHKTLGKWVNVMNGINFFNVDGIQKQIYLRTMKLDEKFFPIRHGDFDEPKYSGCTMDDGKTYHKCADRPGFWTKDFGKVM